LVDRYSRNAWRCDAEHFHCTNLFTAVWFGSCIRGNVTHMRHDFRYSDERRQAVARKYAHIIAALVVGPDEKTCAICLFSHTRDFA
jgi:hypothetical protein